MDSSRIPFTNITAIYVVGPSSTGKTTLCKALSKRLDLDTHAYVTEVARTVMRMTGLTRDDVAKLEMQKAIMEAQLQREQECKVMAANAEHQIMLCDRSAIDPVVYAILTAKNDEEAQERRNSLVDSTGFQLALPAYRQALFILLKPVPDWLIDDGVRSLDNQTQCLEVFRRTLAELGIIYREMGVETRDLGKRVATVMSMLPFAQV